MFSEIGSGQPKMGCQKVSGAASMKFTVSAVSFETPSQCTGELERDDG
jgi:hypothetical protein